MPLNPLTVIEDVLLVLGRHADLIARLVAVLKSGTDTTALVALINQLQREASEHLLSEQIGDRES